MKPWLVPHLICPITQESLQLRTSQKPSDPEILEGELVAVKSRRAYPIVRGIPRFVQTHYAQNFGLEWNKHKRTQFDTSLHQQSRERFFGETGFCEPSLSGKLILDAGCGSGRFAQIAAKAGGSVIGIDISEAVEAAHENLSHFENVTIIQTSIYELPFRKGTFDFVYCLGVLQHTPDPLKSVECLAEMSKPGGGEIGLWWYKKYWWTYLNQKYILRPFFRKWKPEMLYRFISWYVPKLLPVSRLLAKLPFLGPPHNLVDMILPVANRDHVGHLTAEEKVEWAILDTFDWYSAKYDKPQNWKAVESILLTMNYEINRTQRRGLHGRRKK